MMMRNQRNSDERGPRPDSSRPSPRLAPTKGTAQVDVLAATELRLSSSWVSRRLDVPAARVKTEGRGLPLEPKL